MHYNDHGSLRESISAFRALVLKLSVLKLSVYRFIAYSLNNVEVNRELRRFQGRALEIELRRFQYNIEFLGEKSTPRATSVTQLKCYTGSTFVTER